MSSKKKGEKVKEMSTKIIVRERERKKEKNVSAVTPPSFYFISELQGKDAIIYY